MLCKHDTNMATSSMCINTAAILWLLYSICAGYNVRHYVEWHIHVFLKLAPCAMVASYPGLQRIEGLGMRLVLWVQETTVDLEFLPENIFLLLNLLFNFHHHGRALTTELIGQCSFYLYIYI